MSGKVVRGHAQRQGGRQVAAQEVIVAIGEGSSLQEKLATGDQILFQKFSGTEVKLDDGTYVLLAESDILGRIVEVDHIDTSAA
jgi:co-chaperonin GroES (HSP10)